ncbi:helix-turn-helix transcriptional regulator [Desulfovibrionales bacterium]
MAHVPKMMTTKDVAEFLQIHEKMVYTLVADKGLPATKVTGKWLFPRYLVEQWIENSTINFPNTARPITASQRLLVIAGSNDLLLDKTTSLFNRMYSGHLAVFGNIGSMGGVKALRNNLCHIAGSHLIQDDEEDYNFQFASQEFERLPVVVNFCKRRQGLVVAKGNPLDIYTIADLGRQGIRMINRSLSTGTRLLLDKELKKAGIRTDRLVGYDREVSRHMDVGLAVLSGQADVGLAIEEVAVALDLEFVPLRWERFDLLVNKDVFFEHVVQLFLGIFQTDDFKQIGQKLHGYDISMAGKMMYQETR